MNSELPSYLQRHEVDSIEEREIDLLLLLEFHGSPQFRQFVLDRATGKKEGEFVGAWRGVFDTSEGETDVLLLSKATDGKRMAVLIEDKINAPFQINQARRYRARGTIGIAEGVWDEFCTCLCAPSLFLTPHQGSGEWDVLLSFETIVAWLEPKTNSDPRAKFLLRALEKAVGKFKSGGFVPDERAIDFWRSYRAICHAHYADLDMRPLGLAQSRNEPWPNFGIGQFPINVRLEHKPWKGRVDLSFSNVSSDVAASKIGHLIKPPMRLVKAGSSTAIRLSVRSLQHLESFNSQEQIVRESFDAVRTLLRFWLSSGAQLQQSLAEES